jgi:hypothetical protein
VLINCLQVGDTVCIILIDYEFVFDPRIGLSVDAYPEEFRTLELTINRFIPTIIPIHQLNATLPEEKHTLIVVHTLIQVAVLQLYQRFAQDDPVTYDKCSAAAKACATITKYISEQDYDYLDPIIGVSCSISCSNSVLT